MKENNPLLNIRLATSADAPALTKIINDAFRIAEGFFVMRDRIDVDEVRRLLVTGTFLIAEIGDAMAGCVYVEPKPSADLGPIPRAYLGLLSVDPSKQQAGIGSRLMEAAEQHCRQSGCRFMDIRVVNLREELPAYYHKRGYIDAGVSDFPAEIPTSVPCHFLEMTKQLIP